MRMLKQLALVCALACCNAASEAAEPFVWVEGEQAAKRQLVDNAGLNDVNADELSGGAWICSFSHENELTGTAVYAVEVPQTGRYRVRVEAEQTAGRFAFAWGVVE